MSPIAPSSSSSKVLASLVRVQARVEPLFWRAGLRGLPGAELAYLRVLNSVPSSSTLSLSRAALERLVTTWVSHSGSAPSNEGRAQVKLFL